VSIPDYAQALAYAYNLLEQRLAPDLTYHNLWHTREDVVPSCIRLGEQSGISEEEIRLLEVAAAYHDIGFTEQYANHELASARIAAQVLPDFGFSARNIEEVMGMIIATRLPQSPRTLLEEIIADGDLDVLGRADFMPRNQVLREELANRGREMALKPWYEGQLAFLKSHTYFTPAARMLRKAAKRRHIAMLEELLKTMA
jgi:uncharacterized protein